MNSRKIKTITITFIMLISFMFSTTFASAATDPYVTIINPSNNCTVVANSMLISVKVTQPRKLNIYVYQEGASSRTLKLSDSFYCANNLSFYTKKLTSLSPGAYRIHVDTVNSKGKVIYGTDQYVALKSTNNNTSKVVVFSSSSGSSNLIQRMLRYVFGS